MGCMPYFDIPDISGWAPLSACVPHTASFWTFSTGRRLPSGLPCVCRARFSNYIWRWTRECATCLLASAPERDCSFCEFGTLFPLHGYGRLSADSPLRRAVGLPSGGVPADLSECLLVARNQWWA